VGVLVVGIGLGSINLPHYSRLEAHGASVKARVTSTDCADHDSIRYEFRVGEQTHTGRSNVTPGCDRLKTGDTLAVRYLVADPSQSLAGSIDDRLWNEWVSVLLAALLGPLVVVAIVWRVLGRRGYIKEKA
jgi:hypothetical protein